MSTHPIPDFPCPTCGRTLAKCLTRDADPTPPQPGEFTLCGCCGEILIFQDKLSLRPATLNDLVKLTPFEHDYLASLQFAVRQIPRHRRRPAA